MQKSDEVLVEETRRGNKKSFELLIIKYEKQIFNLIFQFTKERDAVPELAQETFFKAYRAINSFKGKSSFYTWLRRIAINNSINYLHARREPASQNGEAFDNQIQNLTDNKFETPENSILMQEASLVVREAMDSLPDSFRSILIMREFEDLSYEEIAETLKCPVGTVRSRLFHARRILKEKLEPYR
ncbi:MAG: sigma-70 family RNA polymerase sigma factor [Pseudomonadota bacterium]